MKELEQTVSEHFNMPTGMPDPKKGEVGIEIELEGKNFPTRLTKWWSVKTDGSLRGNGIEYVHTRPVARDHVRESLVFLQKELNQDGVIVNPSDRCGVHVHLNVLDFRLREIVSFITIYTVLEDLLVKFCGESREGNLFCLRMRDAEFLVDQLVSSIENVDFRHYGADQFKYAALNLNAMGKFGSLEFRSMRATKDFGEIETWVNMLLKIKDASRQFENAQEIVNGVSMAGGAFFLNRVMEEYGEILDCAEAENMIIQGVRRAQLFAFAEPVPKAKKKSHPEEVLMPREGRGRAPRPMHTADEEPEEPAAGEMAITAQEIEEAQWAVRRDEEMLRWAMEFQRLQQAVRPVR